MRNFGLVLCLLIFTLMISSQFVCFNLRESFADSLLKTIQVNNFPYDLEYNPVNNDIYVIHSSPNDLGSVSVIDSSTNEVIDTIELEGDPFLIQFNPSNNNIYVIGMIYSQDNIFVSELDSSTNEVIDTFLISGRAPVSMSFNPFNDYFYIVDRDDHNVKVIDTSDNSFVKNINTGDNPVTIKLNPTNNYLYVINNNFGPISVSIMDSSTNEVIDTIVLDNPADLETKPSKYGLFINSNIIYITDSSTDKIIDVIESPGFPLKLNPHNNLLYASGVRIIDPFNNNVIKTIGVEGNPNWILIIPSSNKIYVGTNVPNDSGFIYIINGNTNTLTETIRVGNNPVKAEFNPTNNNVYVSNFFSHILSVIHVNPTSTSKPTADAGSNQIVNSNEQVYLNGNNSSDPNGSSLTYFWNQTSGPEVTLSDSTSINPTFTAPQVDGQMDIIFQLTVTNEEGISSEPDELVITVNPIVEPPPNPEPKTIGELLRGIIQNPLDVTNSIDSANQIRDILTDNNRDNDKLVCDLIKTNSEFTSNIREILSC